jgi:hypothetical protein
MGWTGCFPGWHCHIAEEEHKNSYASNIFLDDSNRVAPHIHRRRSKGAVRSC